MSVVVTTLVILTGTGCGGGSTDDRLPPLRSPGVASPVATPTLQLTAEEQQAVEEVRAVFDEFMRAYVSLATSGDPPGDEAMRPVLQHLTSPLSQDINTELVDNYLADRRLDGKLTWSFVHAVEVDLERTVNDAPEPIVRLRFCVDARPWTTMDKATREPSADGEPVFASGVGYAGIVGAAHFDPGSVTQGNPRWHLYGWEVEADREC
jgi:hypothetical protein